MDSKHVGALYQAAPNSPPPGLLLQMEALFLAGWLYLRSTVTFRMLPDFERDLPYPRESRSSSWHILSTTSSRFWVLYSSKRAFGDFSVRRRPPRMTPTWEIIRVTWGYWIGVVLELYLEEWVKENEGKFGLENKFVAVFDWKWDFGMKMRFWDFWYEN